MIYCVRIRYLALLGTVMAGLLTIPAARVFSAPVPVAFSFVVVQDLIPRPVPLTDFTVNAASGVMPIQALRTDESGKGHLDLEPGDYEIESKRPVSFGSRTLTWKTSFTVRASGDNNFTFTDGDAKDVGSQPDLGARRISEEAQVYERCRKSVVKIECDSGSGSGFLVDASGLILTNQHVVDKAIHVAVLFADGTKHEGKVVKEDPAADAAVLMVNPVVTQGLTPLSLAEMIDGAVALTGEKVLAIGSPLHQNNVLTIGVVSKAEKDVLISDVNINHGNSGGPLLNLAGQVVGITTFGDVPNSNGPGISGIVCIEKARPVLAAAREAFPTITPPSPEDLPVPSAVPIPLETLNKAATLKLKPIGTTAPKNFEAVVVTPFILASMDAELERELLKERNKRAKDRGKNGLRDQQTLEPKRFWERYAIDDIDGGAAVVAILIQPQLKETSHSVFSGVMSAVLLGARVDRAKLRYRDDFYDMELYRGDKLVKPLLRGRMPASVFDDGVWVDAKDTAMGGLYMYDPSAFEPGEKITLHVRRESKMDEPAVIGFNEKAQKTIWGDFAAWREAVAKSSQ